MTVHIDEDPPRIGLLTRAWRGLLGLFGALFLPDRTLPTVIEEGRYGVALLAGMLCAAAFAAAVGLRIDPTREVLMTGPPGGDGVAMSDREFAEAVQKQRAMHQVTTGLGAVLGTPANTFLLALALFLLGRYVGGKPTLGRTMSLSAYACLPLAVKSLLGAGAALRAVSLSPSEIPALLPQGPPGTALYGLVSGPLARLLSGVDGFSLYALVLVAIGFRSAAQVSRTKALITVIIAFALYLTVTRLLMAGGGPPGPPHQGAR